MKINENVYNTWTDFINSDEYSDYFLEKDEIWINKFNKFKKYINDNKKRPSQYDKNKEIASLSGWYKAQVKNSKNRTQIMAKDIIYNIWNAFANDDEYIEYLLEKEDLWQKRLEQVCEYLDVHDEKPSVNDTDPTKKNLGIWLNNQSAYYKNRTNMLAHDTIYNKWTEFITSDKYKEFFDIESDDAKWKRKFEVMKQYLDDNHSRPNQRSPNEAIRTIAKWIDRQVANAKNRSKMLKNDEIYNIWIRFTTSEQYKVYFN
jgi:tRNA-dihydrouridine synthase